jgi:hypothetical protein
MRTSGNSTSALRATRVVGFDPRADGAQRLVCVRDGKVIIDRQVDGVAMRLELACSAYRGIVLALTGTADAPTFVLRLDHADPELSVTLQETADDSEIVADWRAYAATMGLPRFLEREPGVVEAAETLLGAIAIGPAPLMRRRGAVALRRRPRFLTRRRMGERRLMKTVACGQELSAPF